MNPPIFQQIRTFGAFVPVLFLAIGCKSPEAPRPEPEKVEVNQVDVGTGKTPDVVRLTGTIEGARQTDLAANVSGRVLKTFVDRGTKVKQGDIIARVDVSAAALQLAEAKVQVETSRTQQAIDQVECERYTKLKERGAVTDLEYEQVMARCKKSPLNLDAAQARVSIAAKNVGDGVIRAPFSGVVTDRFVEVGEYVQASTRVVALAEVDALHLKFSVPEADYPKVKIGARVLFQVVAYGDRQFEGAVSRIGGAVRDTRDVLVEALVPNEDGALLPGMFADLRLVVGEKTVAAVPVASVFEQNAKSNVLVVREGALEQRVLQVYERAGDRVLVARGVEPGEKIVAPYRDGLKNGQLIK